MGQNQKLIIQDLSYDTAIALERALLLLLITTVQGSILGLETGNLRAYRGFLTPIG